MVKMDNSISINCLKKQHALQEASNVMEHALKTIADIFKNFQTDYLSLVDDNTRLQLTVKELQKKVDGFCTVCTKKLIEKENIQPNFSDSTTVQNKIIKDWANSRHDVVETLGIIESTQIEEPILCKAKGRHVNKRSNLQINIFRKNINDNNENRINNSDTALGTQRKNEKQSSVAKVNADIINSSGGKTFQCTEVVLQSTDIKVDENIDKELDVEDLNIDATLFEYPFSQEESPAKKLQASSQPNETRIGQDNLGETSPNKLFNDDVVETSPKIDVRKKNPRYRHKQTVPFCMKNPIFDMAMKSDNSGSDVEILCSPKSFKYHTPKETETNEVTANIKTKSRTPNHKTNIISQQMCNEKESSALPSEATFFSLSNSTVTPAVILPKSNVQIATGKSQTDITTLNIPTKTQSREQSSDETLFPADETCFLRHETSPNTRNNEKTEGIINKAKRKFSDMVVSSNVKKITNPTVTELELDIGDMSDWDNDVSCDKWPSTTPQKRVLVNSFDIVPVKKEITPKFATKGPVVRNKLARAKLLGWDCENCAQYYENMGLSEKELQERKNHCSRHRSKFNERYYTPPGLWDLRFPDTQGSSQE